VCCTFCESAASRWPCGARRLCAGCAKQKGMTRFRGHATAAKQIE
jgi:hypothetical protein